MDAEQRRLRARKAALERWAKHDSTKAMAKVRAASPGSVDYWESKVDPDGSLDTAERRKRAQRKRDAYMLGLSMRARKKRAG